MIAHFLQETYKTSYIFANSLKRVVFFIFTLTFIVEQESKTDLRECYHYSTDPLATYNFFSWQFCQNHLEKLC